jgi:wyosine [tRNA(Phe)-imidazoG37] synthetase (radical SAM superfamily)
MSSTHRSGDEARDKLAEAWHRHERRWKDACFVYPVVSRRSRGVSIGINLNPDMSCNFNCIYCQVNRNLPVRVQKVDLETLEKELDAILRAESDGSLYEADPFNILAPHERGVRDVAFSGNGEPTAFPGFEEAIRIAADMRRRFRLDAGKLTLLTNASYLDKTSVRAALALMDDNNGEIWAKLDAGTDLYYRKVNRSAVLFDQILENILGAARLRPLVIQSLWFRICGVPPPPGEIDAYCCRLDNLISAGGQIKGVQLYTIARDPAEAYASPLSNDELDRIALTVRNRVAVPVESFYSR